MKQRSMLVNYRFIFLLAAVSFWNSCTEPIEIKTDNSPPVLVVYGVLTDELKHQEVMISRSSPYFDDIPNAGISGADVRIQSSDNETYSLIEDDSIRGLYYSPRKFKVQSGVQYSLLVEAKVNNSGVKEKYEASTTALPAVKLDSLTFEKISFFGRTNHLLFMHWQDLPEENYYLFHVVYNDSLLTSKISEHLIADNALFKGRYVKAGMYRFDDISNWEKDSPENRERSIYLKPGDVISVETSLISKGYHDFIAQCQQERRGENPMFGGPASNIVSNISNGGVGYFEAYCSKRVIVRFE